MRTTLRCDSEIWELYDLTAALRTTGCEKTLLHRYSSVAVGVVAVALSVPICGLLNGKEFIFLMGNTIFLQ